MQNGPHILEILFSYFLLVMGVLGTLLVIYINSVRGKKMKEIGFLSDEEPFSSRRAFGHKKKINDIVL